jgi:TetR/AcrR family transcriptional regulator, transcriptional repressor for nem operon
MDNTKEFIIDEAFKLFLNRSYEAVSISDISNAIGMTKGALYHHFKNKEELFKSVVDKYIYRPEIAADFETISLFDFIQLGMAQAEKIIRTIFSCSLVFVPIDYMSLFSDAFRHCSGFAESESIFFNNEIEKIRIVVENAIKSGEIRGDINSSIIATSFFSIHIGLAGNLIRNSSIDDAINLLKQQMLEFYKLLKR